MGKATMAMKKTAAKPTLTHGLWWNNVLNAFLLNGTGDMLEPHVKGAGGAHNNCQHK